jgi:hypothetical protein
VLNRDLQYNLLPMTFVSPSVNLDYAVFERADHTSPYEGPHWAGTHFPRWDKRLRMARVHVAFAGAVAVIFAIFGMRQIERRHRVGPWRGELTPHSTVRSEVA